MKILYIKDKAIFGYHKISAIKDNDFQFEEGELDENIFGIITLTIDTEKIAEWSNLNKWCVNDTFDNLIETAEENRLPILEEEKPL